jgi:hypothetical protein
MGRAVVTVRAVIAHCAPLVLLMRHRLEVLRVDAETDTAEVVELKTGRDFSPHRRPNSTMRRRGSSALGDEPVSVSARRGALPDPASAVLLLDSVE